ncbi:hypothetical protein AWL63_24360 (plasmid) [Sphingomonas panacis]|uniref:Uncharacterized protein n=1 Tax=Sphingomonas panacis TaxID=1560345 RepID=A0A1B3ZIM8_9SPHN|nr:hypothetical protein AWL63_24360 [Sphingomonas panacis]
MATQAAAATTAERMRMMAEWQEKAGLLAGSMAEALLARLPAAHTTDAMFDALLERLQGLSEAERRMLSRTPHSSSSPPPPSARQTRHAIATR